MTKKLVNGFNHGIYVAKKFGNEFKFVSFSDVGVGRPRLAAAESARPAPGPYVKWSALRADQ